MPAVVSAPTTYDSRRICSWCGCTLGPLAYPSQYHSYGICVSCTSRYFAHLYESDEESPTEGLRERAVGES
jgi:hypothetical protein